MRWPAPGCGGGALWLRLGPGCGGGAWARARSLPNAASSGGMGIRHRIQVEPGTCGLDSCMGGRQDRVAALRIGSIPTMNAGAGGTWPELADPRSSPRPAASAMRFLPNSSQEDRIVGHGLESGLEPRQVARSEHKPKAVGAPRRRESTRTRPYGPGGWNLSPRRPAERGTPAAPQNVERGTPAAHRHRAPQHARATPPPHPGPRHCPDGPRPRPRPGYTQPVLETTGARPATGDRPLIEEGTTFVP